MTQVVVHLCDSLKSRGCFHGFKIETVFHLEKKTISVV